MSLHVIRGSYVFMWMIFVTTYQDVLTIQMNLTVVSIHGLKKEYFFTKSYLKIFPIKTNHNCTQNYFRDGYLGWHKCHMRWNHLLYRTLDMAYEEVNWIEANVTLPLACDRSSRCGQVFAGGGMGRCQVVVWEDVFLEQLNSDAYVNFRNLYMNNSEQ